VIDLLEVGENAVHSRTVDAGERGFPEPFQNECAQRLLKCRVVANDAEYKAGFGDSGLVGISRITRIWERRGDLREIPMGQIDLGDAGTALGNELRGSSLIPADRILWCRSIPTLPR